MKRRSDCAFGVHFDFHANWTDRKSLGEKFDPKSVEEFIVRVKPDYLQCDTKGHYGLSSYPTKVGTCADLAQGVDILKAWREMTTKHGVGLFAHHSGVFDISAVEKHPEWSARNAKGEIISENDIVPPRHYISVFGPYADELLIPQLLEIANEYKLDGCWIDGDCWSNQLDYSKYAVKAYEEKYGRQPPKPDDKDFHEYVDFLRQGFRDYVHHYAKEIHKAAPDFQIASSWMYTCRMPEEPDRELDYISGDFLGQDSVNFGRFAGRCMSNHGVVWDLMAWSCMPGTKYVFGGDNCHHKEAIHLCQEAAVSFSLGGGFQYCQVQRNGGIERWTIDKAAKVAEFCRERQAFCHRAEHVHQAAVIYSTMAQYSRNDPTFNTGSPTYNSTYGTLLATLDNQYSTEILISYQAMERDLSEYRLLILPDVSAIEPELKDKLIQYTERGGSLIVIGADGTRMFVKQLGIEITGRASDDTYIYAEERSGFLASIYTKYNVVETVSKTARALNRFYLTADSSEDGFIAATVEKCGKGQIAGIYFSLGEYRCLKSPAMRRFFGEILSRMLPDPIVKVSGSHLVDVSLMTKSGKLCVNLINLGGQNGSSVNKTFDEIPPLFGLELEIAFDRVPKAVFVEPGHSTPDFTYANHTIRLTIDRLDIHSVVTVE
jgi:hypothetical protein